MRAPPAAGGSDFFVSYTAADVDWATWIAEQLRSSDYSVAIQASDFSAGDNFVWRMSDELASAGRVIAVASRAYFASDYAKLECSAALALDGGKGDRLVVVRVQDVDLPAVLLPLVHVDLFSRDETGARDALLAAVVASPGPSARMAFPSARPRTRDLPEIWNVPLRPLPEFSGRDQELTRVRRLVAAASPPGLVALVGMGGVGKTRLAAEYAYAHSAEYDLVWWMSGTPVDAVASALAGLGFALDLPELPNLAPQAIALAVRRALEERERWLLIIDDAPNEPAIRDLMPRGGGGNVLLTSRDDGWAEHAALVRLDVLDRAASTALLVARTGQEDGFAAAGVAEALGDLPLALQQAGAYMAATGESAEGYLRLLHVETDEILAASAPSDYAGSVATAWSLSLRALAQASPEALSLLRLLAFVAPDPLPREALEQASDGLPDDLRELTARRVRLNEALAALAQFALVDAGPALACHRLIQTVVREELDPEAARKFTGAAVSLIATCFPASPTFPANFGTGTALFPHAQAVAEHALAERVAAGQAAELLMRVSAHLSYSASPLAGIAPLQKALALLEYEPNPDALRPVVLASTGELMQLLGDFPGAISCFAEAAELAPRGELVRQVRLTSLSEVLREAGQLEESEAAARQALEETPPESDRLPYRLNMLALALQARGDLAEARELLERALPLCVGDAEGFTGSVRNNLGLVLRKQGLFDQAREQVELAAADVARRYGPEHWGMVRALQNLGRVEAAASNAEVAVRWFRRALEIADSTLPPEHPLIAEINDDLQSVASSGRHDRA